MHVEMIPKKISSNDKSGFPAFPPKKKIGVKKRKLRYWRKRRKNAKFRENWASERKL